MKGMLQVITANRLRDGTVVYVGGSGWTEFFDQARPFEDEPSFEAALSLARADERANLVVDVTAADAVREGSALRPNHLREAIRAAGPTVRRDLGKQARNAPAGGGRAAQEPASGEPDVSI